MTKSLANALGLALLATALVFAAGCRGGDGKDKKKSARKRKDSKKQGILRKGQLPRDLKQDVASLLNDLASGDMVKSWRAESELASRDASVLPSVRLMFGSTSPEARAAACRLCYRFKDVKALPSMIDLLSDESRMVRVEASVSLSGMTGQDFDYRPDALQADRDKAIERWQNWYVRTYGAPSRNNRRRR